MEYPSVFPLSEMRDNDSKYIEIEKYFKAKYECSPSFLVRVPGRVNLIGEHIDYCGFSVFPMAIEQDIIVAVSSNKSNVLNISNFDSDKYEDFSSPVTTIDIDVSSLRWYHYFLCGFKGIIEEHKLKSKGLNVVVKGTIPPSSGLSSSSALVCAAALSTTYANRLSVSKMEMSTLCARSEHFIGTEGGGMDQAIGFLAEAGSAKLIEFNPLRATNVVLPKGIAFVVSNSCVTSNKAATNQFNIRVVECRISAKVLAQTCKLDQNTVKRLSDIPFQLGISLSEMATIVKKVLHPEPYTRPELCQLLEITDNQFSSMLSANTTDLQIFKLHQRSLHVYQEAARVKEFQLICESRAPDAIHKLGNLMNESHSSCRDLYECSHPDLDELVEKALLAGAIGSRLTGAGWGGCCVSLVLEENAEYFMNQIKEIFYEKTIKRSQAIKASLFITKPSGGAAIYTS